jgi:hypothetical protein
MIHQIIGELGKEITKVTLNLRVIGNGVDGESRFGDKEIVTFMAHQVHILPMFIHHVLRFRRIVLLKIIVVAYNMIFQFLTRMESDFTVITMAGTTKIMIGLHVLIVIR